jgi:hypothetical protein
MKIKYLWNRWYFKPEYDIDDFARANAMEDYNPRTVLKLMKALYSLWLEENRPEYYTD